MDLAYGKQPKNGRTLKDYSISGDFPLFLVGAAWGKCSAPIVKNAAGKLCSAHEKLQGDVSASWLIHRNPLP